MSSPSYARHRFPPAIIQHAVWLYFRFALSYRDVEDLLAERGIDASYETVRRWALKFGRVYAARIRQRRQRASDRWHLDEVFIRVAGKIHYLWRAVDDEGEVLGRGRSALTQSPGGWSHHQPGHPRPLVPGPARDDQRCARWPLGAALRLYQSA